MRGRQDPAGAEVPEGRLIERATLLTLASEYHQVVEKFVRRLPWSKPILRYPNGVVERVIRP